MHDLIMFLLSDVIFLDIW